MTNVTRHPSVPSLPLLLYQLHADFWRALAKIDDSWNVFS